MGTPDTMTRKELLEAALREAPRSPRWRQQFRAAALKYGLDKRLLADLAGYLVDDERSPQRLSELQRSDLEEALRLTEGVHLITPADGAIQLDTEAERKRHLSWTLKVLHWGYANLIEGHLNTETDVYLSRSGYWIVVVHLKGSATIATANWSDTARLHSLIRAGVPEWATPYQPNGSPYNVEKALLTIYMNIVMQEQTANIRRAELLTRAERETDLHAFHASHFEL